MEPIRQFSDYLNRFVTLDEAEFNAVIQPRIQLRRFNKKEIVTQAGETERYLNFVVKGLVRKYFRKGDEEFITQISLENQLIYSQESFYSQTPSDYFVEPIEPTTLISINREDLDDIFASSANMERLGRKIVTFVLVQTEH